LEQLEPREVIVIGDTIEETISAVQNATNQSNGALLSRESAVYRAMELSTQRVKKLVADKKKWSEEKVQLTADVERNKRAMLSMTLEMEGMKEELQTYKELPSTLKQRQIDQAQLKEELEKLKAEYQKVTRYLGVPNRT
jgi:predicted RNase H-like nuclease (RuvC/YqgF family)